ncbi:MAG TPA: hypothetical protein VGH96_20070 [Streptosporangiaceae bacterium]
MSPAAAVRPCDLCDAGPDAVRPDEAATVSPAFQLPCWLTAGWLTAAAAPARLVAPSATAGTAAAAGAVARSGCGAAANVADVARVAAVGPNTSSRQMAQPTISMTSASAARPIDT